MTNFNESFGEYLRRIRKSKNLTLSDLEEKTGISLSHLSRAERDERTLSIDYIKKIAEFLEINEKILLDKAGYITSTHQLLEFIKTHQRLPNRIPKETLTEYINQLLSKYIKKTDSKTIKNVPVIEITPTFSIKEFEEQSTYVDYKKVHISDLFNIDNPLYLKINNDNFIIEGIRRNDLVLVNQTKKPKNGSINLIHIKNEGVLLRRVYEEGDWYLIQGSKTNEKPLMIPKSNLNILGVAVELRRDL
jgi:transcriptional regulator with XRE-family HTH domain